MKRSVLLYTLGLLLFAVIEIAQAEIKTQPPLLSPKVKLQSEIKQLLGKAERAIKDRRLSKPHQDSALYFIDALAEKAPGHKRINGLLEQVVNSYSDLVKLKLTQDNVESAINYWQRATAIAKQYNLASKQSDLERLSQAISAHRKQQAEAKAEQARIQLQEQAQQDAEAATQMQESATVEPNQSKQSIVDVNLTESKAVKQINLLPGQPGEPEMVLIPVAEKKFTMGSPYQELGRAKNERQAQVAIPAAYALARYEVTLAEYQEFVDASQYKSRNSETKPDASSSWRKPGFKQSGEHPVVNISWYDAMAYIQWLNQRFPGRGYRLPTEAEWEYAARAGTQTAHFWGDETSSACAYANARDLTAIERNPADDPLLCSDGYAYTAPVNSRSFQVNAYGLSHMLGNVREWTCSSYQDRYKGREQQCVSVDSEDLRVLRGGSWHDNGKRIRSADRDVEPPELRNNMTGFRLARSL